MNNYLSLFQNVSPWQHPVFLLDVPYRDLEGIVEFIYHGEASVLFDLIAKLVEINFVNYHYKVASSIYPSKHLNHYR